MSGVDDTVSRLCYQARLSGEPLRRPAYEENRLANPTESHRPRVEIIVLDYNGLDDTVRCLESLGALDYDNFGVVVIDNASTIDPIPTLRSKFPQFESIRLPVNTGWAGGNNAGLRQVLHRRPDYLVLLNNDTIVSPHLLSRLVEAAEREPSYGIIGPLIAWMEDRDVVMTDGNRFNPPGFPGFFERVEVPPADLPPERAAPPVTPIELVNGCCMFIRREVFEAVGLIDDTFFLQHEESDFCLRAEAAGVHCGILPQILVWHEGSAAFNREGSSGVAWKAYFSSRNLLRMIGRHSGGQRRDFLPSLGRFVRYTHHLRTYAHEEGHDATADAYVFGIVDALRGVSGGVWQWERDLPFRLISGAFDAAEALARARRRGSGGT